MPLIGHVDEISRNLVSGWAIDTDNPGRSCEIIIEVDSHTRTSLVADRHRPGVGESMKSSIDSNLHDAITYAYGFEIALDPPLSIFEEHEVVVKFAGTGTNLRRGSKKLPIPNIGRADMIPVMITAFGRSGTTILMQFLSRHPGIVVAERYPFEIKLLTYYVAVYRTLVSGADRERSSTPETIAQDPFFIGFNPFNRPAFYNTAKDFRLMEELFERAAPQTFAESCRNVLVDYYKILKADQKKLGAAYFAEKVAPDAALKQGARLLCGDSRTILLVRDPRDVIASAMKYWKGDARATVFGLGQAMERVQAMDDEGSMDTILVRYEDLIGDPAGTLSRIHQFLGLEAHTDSTDDQMDGRLFGQHGTSASPEASIGKWRTDLTEADRAVCEAELGQYIERFGYTR